MPPAVQVQPMSPTTAFPSVVGAELEDVANTRSMRQIESTSSMRHTGSASSALSAWRLPSQAGKLPGYIRAEYRSKTFGLLACQCTVVFCVSLLIEVYIKRLQLSNPFI